MSQHTFHTTHIYVRMYMGLVLPGFVDGAGWRAKFSAYNTGACVSHASRESASASVVSVVYFCAASPSVTFLFSLARTTDGVLNAFSTSDISGDGHPRSTGEYATRPRSDVASARVTVVSPPRIEWQYRQLRDKHRPAVALFDRGSRSPAQHGSSPGAAARARLLTHAERLVAGLFSPFECRVPRSRSVCSRRMDTRHRNDGVVSGAVPRIDQPVRQPGRPSLL